jgi:diguanylate cyclase (GGDEF)-like protein
VTLGAETHQYLDPAARAALAGVGSVMRALIGSNGDITADVLARITTLTGSQGAAHLDRERRVIASSGWELMERTGRRQGDVPAGLRVETFDLPTALGHLALLRPQGSARTDPSLIGALLPAFALGHQASEPSISAPSSGESTVDALTGLASRAELFRRTDEELLDRRPTEGSVAIVSLDLDRFSQINDLFGFDTGDQALVEVGKVLRSGIRRRDLAVRIGGDEFALLVTMLEGPHEAMSIVQRISRLLSRPVMASGASIQIEASLGVAVSEGNGETASELLRRADAALHQAKQDRGSKTASHIEQMESARTQREELASHLEWALGRGELTLAYQPQLDLNTGHLRGVEALMRWNDPVRGPISPVEFIPIAEETGLISTLGQWALVEACAQVQLWSDRLGPEYAVPVSVNLSGRQFADAALLDDISRAIAESGIMPGQLTLEVTETYLMQRNEEVRAQLLDLKTLGVRLAIDDFGTGYSSLAYLREFPFDECKIDKSFVHGIGRNQQSEVLTSTIALLGEKLGLEVVAEGIETAAQHEFLREVGCPTGQGYLFAAPLEPEAAFAYLEAIKDRIPRRTFLALAPRRVVGVSGDATSTVVSTDGAVNPESTRSEGSAPKSDALSALGTV